MTFSVAFGNLLLLGLAGYCLLVLVALSWMRAARIGDDQAERQARELEGGDS